MSGVTDLNSDFGPGVIGAVVGAFVMGLFNWLIQRSKGGTDQSVAVIAEWSKLNKGLADRLAAVEKAFADYRLQVAREIDEMRAKHRAEMRALRELNEGLQRMIAQNSQSSANLIGDFPAKPRGDE